MLGLIFVGGAGAAPTATVGDKIAFTETELVAGTQVTTITLLGDTWVAAGAGPIGSVADTQALIDGFDSAQVEATGWNAEIRDKEVTTAVVRTSNTVATITWTASPAYDVTSDETITVTVPAVALAGAAALTGTPVITVTATIDTPPVDTTPGKDGGGMGGYQRARRRKELRLMIQDDEDFMKMVAQALPEILRKIL